MEVVQEQWKGTPHCLGRKRGPYEKAVSSLLKFRRVPQVKCTSRMWTGLGCPAVATDVGVWG